MSSEELVRVRIAPSPTGLLHVGTVRTALFNYYFARQNQGTFIIRIEDTDTARSTREFEENIITGLRNLGLEADEDPAKSGPYAPYRQSERKATYRPYLEQILSEGKAYYCYCTKEELEKIHQEQVAKKQAPRYPGTCHNRSEEDKQERIAQGINPVIRIKIADSTKVVGFKDIIRGKIEQHTKELDDFIIAKDLENPLYNFVVVIDDVLMKITHIIRGEDHIPNTFKQLLIYQAIGIENPPHFAHLPLILNTDKTKLSKRKNKVSINDYLDEGYLPEAIINFLSLLGWNPGNNQEIMDLRTITSLFNLSKVQKSGAVFDATKFLWINGQYIRKLPSKDFLARSKNFLGKYANYDDRILEQGLALIQERCKKLSEIPELLDPLLEEKDWDISLLTSQKIPPATVLLALEIGQRVLQDWSRTETSSLENKELVCEELKQLFIKEITAHNLKNGDVLWPVRAALSGQSASPGAFEMIWFLGREKSLQKLKAVHAKLRS